RVVSPLSKKRKVEKEEEGKKEEEEEDDNEEKKEKEEDEESEADGSSESSDSTGDSHSDMDTKEAVDEEADYMLTLPQELLSKIVSLLSTHDRRRLGVTCTRMASAVAVTPMEAGRLDAAQKPV
ncbi:hypothetical protein PFISCL1PPCAC_7800, partial [Pristionchus fissidentatus]